MRGRVRVSRRRLLWIDGRLHVLQVFAITVFVVLPRLYQARLLRALTATRDAKLESKQPLLSGSLNDDCTGSAPAAEELQLDNSDRWLPRLPHFKVLAVLGGSLVVAAATFGMVKLCLLFNDTSSPLTWAFVLLCIALPCFQASAGLRHIEAIDAATVRAYSAADPQHPLLVSTEDDGHICPTGCRRFVYRMGLSRAVRTKTKAQQKEAEEKRKKKKKASLHVAKVTTSRLLSLSKPDVPLLLAGFLALVAASIATTLIPHFTGSVVNKVLALSTSLNLSLYVVVSS